MPEWLENLLGAVDKFVVTPKEQLEYDASIARARADESIAAAQIAAATKQNQTINMVLMGAAGVGVVLIVVNMMKS